MVAISKIACRHILSAYKLKLTFQKFSANVKHFFFTVYFRNKVKSYGAYFTFHRMCYVVTEVSKRKICHNTHCATDLKKTLGNISLRLDKKWYH
jgi:hypothetical protein